MARNGYMLKGKLKNKGFDLWRHTFVGKNIKTGEKKAFFIEYYIVNPGLFQSEIKFGRESESPSYAMIKVGVWGKNPIQINKFYKITEFAAAERVKNIMIGNSNATETELAGDAEIERNEAEKHPEFMSGYGKIEWDLKIKKSLAYNVGYYASTLFRMANVFNTYWHVEGMSKDVSGKIILNGEIYNVSGEESLGYQDKLWGSELPNPWMWLNCNNLVSQKNDEKPPLTSLAVCGWKPAFLGVPLKKGIIVAFYYNGKLYEYNFTKFWRGTRQTFDCREDEDFIYWDLSGEDMKTMVEIDFQCQKSKMINASYENPGNGKTYNRLMSGGTAFGTVKIYEKKKGGYVLQDELFGEFGGCGYGEY